jgi:phosphatidate cytidylyltransferase
MKRVLTAVVLIPLVLALVLRGPLWLVALVAALFAVLATREYLDLISAQNLPALRLPAWIVVAALLATMVLATVGEELSEAAIGIGLVTLLIGPYIFLATAIRQADFRGAIGVAAASALAIPYVVIPLGIVVVLRSLTTGWYYLILLFTIVWSGDIFAYYIGRAIGRHKLAARVSPKKSWEGAIASLVGSALLAVVITQFGPSLQERLVGVGLVDAPQSGDYGGPILRPPVWVALLFAVVVNASAQVGDLVESMIKRGAGVKDSGTLMPGHGGILDRIDALLFAAPAAAVYLIPMQHYFVTPGS